MEKVRDKKYFILCIKNGNYYIRYVKGWETKYKNIVVIYDHVEKQYTLTHKKCGLSLDEQGVSYKTKKEALESLENIMRDSKKVSDLNERIKRINKQIKEIIKMCLENGYTE